MEVACLETQTQPQRTIFPLERTLVAHGLKSESRISLYALRFESSPRSFVFVYPASLNLNAQRITDFGPFSDIEEVVISREFKNLDYLELNKRFLKSPDTPISIFDHDYKSSAVPIIGHSYDICAIVLLNDIIKDLK